MSTKNDMQRRPPPLPFPITHPLVWVPLLISLALAALIYTSNNNTYLFLLLNAPHGAVIDAVWANFTTLGDTWVALALLALFAARAPRVVFAALVAALFATMWARGLKGVLDLPRPASVLAPDLIHIVGPMLNKHSFPSGHTTTIFALAGVICLLVQNTAVRATALALAVGVAVSRVAVGAHWPLDVLAGAFGGWLSAVMGIIFAHGWPWGTSALARKIFSALLLLCSAGLFVHDTQFGDLAFIQYVVAVAGIVGAALGLRAAFAVKPPPS